jgi:hypothetical protein
MARREQTLHLRKGEDFREFTEKVLLSRLRSTPFTGKKAELFKIFYLRFPDSPTPLHPGQEALDKITALVKKA